MRRNPPKTSDLPAWWIALRLSTLPSLVRSLSEITLKTFSEKTRAYHQYQARQNYWRQQQSIQNHLEALRTEVEQARAAEQRERAEKEVALAEIERLKALLGN